MAEEASQDRVESFKLASRGYSDASILMHEAIARKAGLSGTDHKYLGLLIQKGCMTAGELSMATGLTTGAVTGLIDRLEKRELVKREFDKSDRRKVIIVAQVEKVMSLLEPIFAELQAKTSKLIASFSESEIQIVMRYFLAATDIMNDVSNQLNNSKN